MDSVRVVAGTGTGPTPTAAYDAALLDAGVGNYNLVTVSSVVPSGATLETLETAPDVGEVGDRLTVVQARAVGTRVAAALAWARTETGEGLFYEGSAADPPAVDQSSPSARERDDEAAFSEDRETATAPEVGPDAASGADTETLRARALREAERGLSAGFDRRGWTPAERSSLAVATTVGPPPQAETELGRERERHAAAAVLAVYGDGEALV